MFRKRVALIILGLSAVWLCRPYLSSAGLEAIVGRVHALGSLGPVLMILVYILACVVALPASILTLACGFLFGIWKGYLVVAIGSLLGASAAFWIGRTVAREWVKDRAAKHRLFSAIDRAVTQNGFKMVLLTRLSPAFPFNLQNFAYGVTGVSFREYVWASWIGMLPGTVLLVYLGSVMESIAEVVSGKIQPGIGRQVGFAVGFLATVGVTILVTKTAKKYLNETLSRPA